MTRGINLRGKVIEYNIADRVEFYRSRGYSYVDTAKAINDELPDGKSISKDAICRYEKNKYKRTKQLKPMQSLEDINDNFRNVYFNVDTLQSFK